MLSLFQVCCDYVFAFAALGVAGFFGKKKNGLLIGYIVAVLARIFPYVRRISVLDGLYAGEFPAVFEGAVSDYLQLQLSAG